MPRLRLSAAALALILVVGTDNKHGPAQTAKSFKFRKEKLYRKLRLQATSLCTQLIWRRGLPLALLFIRRTIIGTYAPEWGTCRGLGDEVHQGVKWYIT